MKILLCDDHAAIREGVKAVLETNKEISKVVEASDAKEALEHLKKNKYDLVLLDISLPDINGLELIYTLKEKWPGLNILIYTVYSPELFGVQSIQAGAMGYLSKTAPMKELLLAIHTVVQGKKYITPELAVLLADSVSQSDNTPKHLFFSKRETEIMLKLANGASNKDIASDMLISEKSVSNVKQDIYFKLKLKNIAELTKYCIKNKLIIND